MSKAEENKEGGFYVVEGKFKNWYSASCWDK